jgi:hypothetical protein
MNELPREARAMLALAKDAHDPPERERVRGRVLAAVAIAPLGLSASALAKPSAGLFKAWFGGKSALAGALLLLAAGGSLAALRARPDAPTRSARVAQPAPVEQQDAPAAPGKGVEGAAAPAADVMRGKGPARAGRASVKNNGAAAPSLHAEVSLLTRAEDQLERGDAQAALRSLQEHRRRFAHSQLQPEREGLEVLAHCQQKQAKSQAAARAYLARTPASLLVARIEHTCEL